MGSKLTIPIFVFLTTCPALGASATPKTVLRDGFFLSGVDGKVTPSENKWSFELDSDITDDTAILKTGTSLQLLPSVTLEKLAADTKERSSTNYRLWARVTKYKDENFIFPIYFLPLSKVELPQPPKPEEPQQQQSKLTINEPNDRLAIPEEIIAKLSTRKILRTEQLRPPLELKQDSIIADRTGFLRDSGRDASFVLDALGRNVQQLSFKLLPCQVLELAQQKQAAAPDPIRFKIAAIVTKYKDHNYLLLQRATRIYSHQNFPR
ncbi:MAG: hypothetical protein JSV99_05305 [Planctomycetota bacterium]|nr:MAG: hypothetical protein JSV99_05305 [Planctomycetota bacterium]